MTPDHEILVRAAHALTLAALVAALEVMVKDSV